MHRSESWTTASFMACAVSALLASAQGRSAEIQPLGVLPGARDSYAYFLAEDGNTAVVSSYTPATAAHEVAIWTSSEGLRSLTLPGHQGSTIAFLSSSGSLAAGTSCTADYDCEAFIWTPVGGLEGLGYLPGDTYSDFGANPARDSGVVVARSCPSRTQRDQCRPFIWTATGGKREVGILPGKIESRELNISADGSVLTGMSCNRAGTNPVECEAFILDVVANSIVGLGVLPGYSQSEPRGIISSDHSALAVQSCDSSGYMQCQAAVWTAGTGLQGLGFLPGDTFSLAWGISADGSTVVGSSGHDVNSPFRPFVWTAQGGMQELPQRNSGADRVLSLSSDGSFIVGDTYGTAGNGTVIWTAPDWASQLLALPGDSFGNARFVNDALVTGESGGENNGSLYFQPVRWTPSGGLHALGLFPGYQVGFSLDASADGSRIVGWQAIADYSLYEAFVWSTTSGLEGLGFLEGDIYGDAIDISANGEYVLGNSCDDIDCQAVLWRLYSPNQVQTPVGDEVTVDPVVTLPGSSSTTIVQLTFDSVETGGVTTITAASTPNSGGTESPPGFELGDPPVYYDVSTTANFTGPVNLCFSWEEGQFENESNIKLFHYEGGAWQDVTTSLDILANAICGQVTSLSPFALFEAAFAFEFAGFFSPVDNPPTRNVAKAGSAIPVKFSLNGDQGLAIFDIGYPVSQAMQCDRTTPTDPVSETVSAGASGLSYEASTDQYVYVWKTTKAWANSCRRLIVQLVDGTQHTAEFEFVK